MRRRVLNVLTALSLLLCVAAGGCIYIPAPDSPRGRGAPNPHRLIGGSTSKKPVRPGAVTRDQVVERFGKPYWQDPGGQAVIYTFRMDAGYWVVIPFGVWRSDRLVAARFEFAQDGVLDAVRVERGGHRPANLSGPTLPWPPMLQELMRPTTRPATTRSQTEAGQPQL